MVISPIFIVCIVICCLFDFIKKKASNGEKHVSTMEIWYFCFCSMHTFEEGYSLFITLQLQWMFKGFLKK